MRERVKSVTLLLLVLLSLSLTSRLIFGHKYLEIASPPEYEHFTFGELKPSDRLIYPTLRLLQEGKKRELQPWSLQHPETWAALLFLMEPQELPELAPAPELKTGRVLEIEFPVPIDVVLWFKLSPIESLNVKAIVWFEEDSQAVWYRDDSDRWWRAADFSLPEDWNTILAEGFSAAQSYRAATAEELSPFTTEQTFFFPESVPTMSRYTVIAEPLEKEKLQRSVFINMAMVRKIEERDGAIIYTDGQRGLRFFPHGEFELTVPENEPGTASFTNLEILLKTAQYLHLTGGWPEQLYLQTIIVNENSIFNLQKWYTQEVLFQYAQQEYLIIGHKPPLQMSFSDRGIIYYDRQIHQLVGPTGTAQQLISPQKALAAAAKYLGEQTATMQLQVITPVYYIDGVVKPQLLAHPAWYIRFSNQQALIIDGFSGYFLAWQE